MISNRITTVDTCNYEMVQNCFNLHVDSQALMDYKLPGCVQRTRVVIGLSGGADSTVLAMFAAVFLSKHYTSIEYIFTDTKAEPESAYETLDNLESFLGIKITRIKPANGLFELIEKYNGFLPSTRARWCTRELKVDPLIEYMKELADVDYVSLAGIRFDELDRDGISFQHTMEHAKAAFPFIDLKITKSAVFSILSNTIGIPRSYQYRSRSGCFSCFFQRNAEILGMLIYEPAQFAITEAKEKLSDTDEQRWSDIPLSVSDLGIQAVYPVPAFIDIRDAKRLPDRQPKNLSKNTLPNLDLFENETSADEEVSMFAAFALYVDPRLGWFGGREFTPGVYFQQFITVSTSLQGLKSALGTYYAYRKTTPMPQFDLDDLKIIIAQIQFPVGAIDTAPPSCESFTWKKNVSYKQIRHLFKHCQVTLERVDLERRFLAAKAIAMQASNEDSFYDAMESLEYLKVQLREAPVPKGRLVWEGLYSPSKGVSKSVQLQLEGVTQDSEITVARENIEFDEVPRACIACSI